MKTLRVVAFIVDVGYYLDSILLAKSAVLAIM